LACALRGAAAVVAISHAVRAELRHLAGEDLAVEVVPNGVVTRERWHALQAMAAERWVHTRPFRFVLLGLFHPSKGQLEAVESLAQVRAQGVDARLVLAGGGNDAAVRERIRALGVEEAVELPGFVDDPFAVLLRAHALLNCSRHEAMGRTTWEAMACGLPVIGHASGATPELVHPERTGLLYRTSVELAAHMRRLATAPAEAQRMGLEACRTLPEAATVEAMCGRMAQLYCRITGRAQP
jgi:glycosyltransferase involved in cell wall biosynthesis